MFFVFAMYACLAQAGAMAQTMKQTFVVRDGKLVGSSGQGPLSPPGGAGRAAVSEAPVITPSQQLIFDANKKILQGDYASAEALYNKAIALDGNNASAYLQRGVVRREMKNEPGMRADAQMAIALLNQKLQADNRSAGAYHERSMAYRLLKQFDAAKQDLTLAIQLSGNARWQTDMTALELERKMAVSQ